MQAQNAGVGLLVLAVCCCAVSAAAQDEFGFSHSIRGLQGRKLLLVGPASHGLPTAVFRRTLHDEQELQHASAARGVTSAEQMATGTSSSLSTPAAWKHRSLLETLTAQARAILQGGGSAQGQKEEKKEDNKGSDKKEEKTDGKKVEEKKDGGNLPVWGPTDTKADQGKGGNANQDKKDEKANSGNTPVWGPADTYEKIKGRGGC